MKIKSCTVFVLLCAFGMSNTLYTQIHIKGGVEIDLNSGLFKCEFDLSNIPELKEYHILLNKGMNIKYFKDNENELIDYQGHYDGKIVGEAIAYSFNIDDAEHIPSTFHISYKGAFPIYSDDFNQFDYKGVIALNGQTLRATEQTKWYPVIYDTENDKPIQSYTYDLTVSIKGGNTIFINGTAPKKGTSAHFVSKKAYPLLLFAGNYNFIENHGDYILNASVTKANAKTIFENIELIKNNLSKNLGIAFTDNIYIINHKAINERKKGSSWGFNTYPSFAFTGLNFDKLVDDRGKFFDHHYKYFGHEFGHNYFGANVMSGKLGWFWLESFAEYLSYNTAEDLAGKQFLSEVLINQLKYIKDDSFIPLNKIKRKDEIGEKYRYILAPLMLKCFEDTFGRNKMNLIMKSLLEFAENEILTLEHFKNAAIKIGVERDQFEAFEKEFITDDNFKENIVSEIKKNYG